MNPKSVYSASFRPPSQARREENREESSPRRWLDIIPSPIAFVRQFFESGPTTTGRSGFLLVALLWPLRVDPRAILGPHPGWFQARRASYAIWILTTRTYLMASLPPISGREPRRSPRHISGRHLHPLPCCQCGGLLLPGSGMNIAFCLFIMERQRSRHIPFLELAMARANTLGSGC